MPLKLNSDYPDVGDLLSLEVEELGAALLESLQIYTRGNPEKRFSPVDILNECCQNLGDEPHKYPRTRRTDLEVAMNEALQWLRSNSFVVREAGSNGEGGYHVLMRRGRAEKAANKTLGSTPINSCLVA
jgi:hypothetical protein